MKNENKFMSLEWFKAQVESSVDKAISKKIDKLIDDKPSKKDKVTDSEATIKNVKLVNDLLTVILTDGEILTKSEATIDDFVAINDADTMPQVRKIIENIEGRKERVAENISVNKLKNIMKGVKKLVHTGDFYIEDNSVYMTGVHRTIPSLLVERFAEIVGHYYKKKKGLKKTQKDEEYISLKKFWLKCCLNPNAHSAEDLYTFLSHHNFKIDKHGNFYAYRRVVSKAGTNSELVEFISDAYTKVKAVWKKCPKNYTVYYNVEGKLLFTSMETYTEPTLVGNLEELYLNLPTMQANSYTSAHTGEEDYKIGNSISMPRQQGNDSNKVSCSKGFHAASKAYDYSGFGDTPILVIINPMDVLAVPHGEVGKLRTCRWFFATTLSEEEQFILDDEEYDVSELGDIFEAECNQGLKDYVHNSYAEEVQRHTFTIPEISHVTIKNIVKSLKSMKTVLKDRVQTIE